MSRFYPYSFFSAQKTISYNSDDTVIQKYLNDLITFGKVNKENAQDDLLKTRTTYVLQMYEQNWLTSEKAIKIHYRDLDTILTEVKNTRYLLLELAFLEGYSQEGKEYLKKYSTMLRY